MDRVDSVLESPMFLDHVLGPIRCVYTLRISILLIMFAEIPQRKTTDSDPPAAPDDQIITGVPP